MRKLLAVALLAFLLSGCTGGVGGGLFSSLGGGGLLASLFTGGAASAVTSFGAAEIFGGASSGSFLLASASSASSFAAIPNPEPGTMALFGIGLSGLALARLRRKK